MTEYQTHAALVATLETEIVRLRAVNAELRKSIQAPVHPGTKQAQAARQALEALEPIHHGNMTPMAESAWKDATNALREALEQCAQNTEDEDQSDASMKLAEMILSDCGCSSNYTPLLERVAKRIDRHVATATAPQPHAGGQDDDLRSDALQTLSYCAGLKAGWNFCVSGDDAGFERAKSQSSEALHVLRAEKKSPARQQLTDEESRTKFEVWAASYSTLSIERDDDPVLGITGYRSMEQTMLWHAWQAAKTKAPEGASEGESGANARLGLAGHDSNWKHEFSVQPSSGIRLCAHCGLSEVATRKHTAPQPTRQPLSDKQIQDIWCSAKNEDHQHGPFWFAHAIERAHGIGGEA